MEKTVIFRAYQEHVADDYNALQEHARGGLDHVVNDAVTATRRYSGFAVTKTAQAEVTIAPGRFYDQGGGRYARNTALVASMVPHLAAAARRIVTVSVYGVENETDNDTRDFAVIANPDAPLEVGQAIPTEPDVVAMTLSRDAVLVFTKGAESADPQPAAIPATHVAIANVLVDNLSVVDVEMIEANAVTSTENLDLRADVLESDMSAIKPRVDALATSIADILMQLRNKGQARAITQIYQDVARLKELQGLPDDATDYGADRFLDLDESDHTNSASLGYDAKVEEGARFSFANMDEFELDIFSANDPNAKLTNGLLLPAYDSVLKLAIADYHSDLGIAQYGFQNIDIVQRSVARQRTRYGSIFNACSNSAWWNSGQYDSAAGIFRKDGEAFEVLDYDRDAPGNIHAIIRMRQVWVDNYQEPYWDYVKTEHAIVGAQVAQSVLVPADMWLTRLGFHLTVKAANEAVHLTVVEMTNGRPDREKAVLHHTVPHGNLEVNGWTRAQVPPTFLRAGRRYAVLLTSNANHHVGMSFGQQYLDGTFFVSTDGDFFQGDLTKDMMVELWGAKFRAPQVTIEFEALNLDGGIRAIDILAGTIAPDSTDLVYEVRPGGSGAWIPLRPEDLSAFASTPPLAHFRGRFVGTRDMMPGLMLTGSRVRVSRPKTTFKHVSTVITLAAPSNNITVAVVLENFDETPHNLTCTLRNGATNESPDTTVTTAMPDLPSITGRYTRTFSFLLPAPISTFRLIFDGTTNSAGHVFHVSERVHYAQ